MRHSPSFVICMLNESAWFNLRVIGIDFIVLYRTLFLIAVPQILELRWWMHIVDGNRARHDYISHNMSSLYGKEILAWRVS